MESYPRDKIIIGQESHNEENTVAQQDSHKSSKPPSDKKKWLWLLLSLLLIGGGGIIAWRILTPSGGQGQTQTNQRPPTLVELSPVETGILQTSHTYRATLESRRSVTLQPRIQGQVTQILVRPGTRVPAGTEIMQIDSREQQLGLSGLKAAVSAARSQLANSQATLKSLEADRISKVADVRLNEQEYQRYLALVREGAESRQTLDQFNNRLASAKASLGTINAQIEAQKAAVSQAKDALVQSQANAKQQQVQLQYYKIEAPFTGTVGNIPVKVGDFVNTSTQLATVTENQPLEVEVAVPIQRAPELRKGMPVEILDGSGKVIGTSRVFFISPSARSGDQQILVKTLFDNSKNLLRAGESVDARIIWDRRPGVLIPVNSVFRLAGKPFVFVTQRQQSKDGKTQLVAKQKRVELGDIKNNKYQVISGLEVGERIIVSGLLNLTEGMPINPKGGSGMSNMEKNNSESSNSESSNSQQ
ncbi:MAG: efflux RND transporter periplasmic adaptor subunit [Mastigocoleus sp.]